MTDPELQRLVGPILGRYLGSEISAPIAIMELLLATSDAAAVARAIGMREGDACQLASLAQLAATHASGCAKIETMLRTGLDRPEPPVTVEDGIARARRLFDDSVMRSEEASVALYSLGSPEVLAAATAEAAAVLERWGVLAPGRDALEIGCGIGRFLVPLAGCLRSVVGIDISANMVRAALARTDQLANVRVAVTTGRDLADLASAAFDLVYAIDTMPYVVRAGRELAATHVCEAARVLRPGGDLVIFNYAYDRTREDMNRELRELAEAAGLRVVRMDEAPFTLWKAVGYQLRRP